MAGVKVTIVGGAGGVGASTAFNLALMRGGHEVVLVDNRPEMITSHVMDLEQVLEQSPGCTVRGGDLGDVPGSDVVVLLSATPLTVGTSRLEYLEQERGHRRRARGCLPGRAGAASSWSSRIPSIPLVTRVQARTGFDRRRVLGYTLNDSLRLRTGLAKALGTPPGSVEAWVARRARRHERPALSTRQRRRRAGAPHRRCSAAIAEEYLRNWYVRHVALDSGRSSTWTSGLGVARMVTALDGAGELWPASLVLDGEYGISGVAVTVPVTLGRGGAEQIHEWDIAEGELEALHASAEFVRAAVARLR